MFRFTIICLISGKLLFNACSVLSRWQFVASWIKVFKKALFVWIDAGKISFKTTRQISWKQFHLTLPYLFQIIWIYFQEFFPNYECLNVWTKYEFMNRNNNSNKENMLTIIKWVIFIIKDYQICVNNKTSIGST